MKFYFAPMEGVTRYVYRNAFETYFGKIDRYFAPFVCANGSGNYKNREITDILPENNQGITLIPQILTCNAKDFILAAKKMESLGYDTINLNLGCPSGTVVSKKKGSGFLAYPEELDTFLAEIFAESQLKISIKTRIGKEDPEEFYRLLEIYDRYPLEELIIHPRVQKDFYKNSPNLTMFEEAVKHCHHPLCYNGDITTVADYERITERFPTVDRIMIGRGLIGNPNLIFSILGEEKKNKLTVKRFHDEVYKGYRILMAEERNAMFKMKEFWFYMSSMFTNSEKYAKKIKKAQKASEYEDAVNALFREQELIE
ncbi:tRNA dihydrouridine synthase [Anaerosporobacter faecicola]|uniref:tRNA dihydrouridine synthase n=1 Tax=Anaerosporobacter faecicola TaxID=2718714 RepID=UPI00143B2C2B|nr:tRNA-dihydrouridine synthase family protein [Anaerosporobacter faecicola]